MSTLDRPEVLILHASIGSGHTMAATAIAERIREIGGADRGVQLVDLLQVGHLPAKSRLSSVFSASRLSGSYDAMWDAEWLGPPCVRLAQLARPFMFPDLKGVFTARTGVVISTHAMGAILATRHPEMRRISVMTDLLPHAFWPRNTDRMCAATPEAQDTLERRGFEPERIEITGIPVRSQFDVLPSRSEARARLDLPADKPVALVAAGASDPGPYSHVSQTIAGTIGALLDLDMTALVLTGTDTELLEHIRSHFDDRVKALPFTEDMATPMAAADIVAAKAGGAIVAECLTCAKPLVLLARGSGQERANCEYLKKRGAAFIAETEVQLREKLAPIIHSESGLGRLSECAGDLGTHDAARRIAAIALAESE